MKKILLNKKEANRGITLIALIITIIVLLILAGVTIATLTGENGILTQAKNAKNEMTKAEAKERIQLEVLGSYGTDGEINIATLKANIAKNIPEAVIGEETELPLTVTVGDYTFTVKANGVVEEGNSGEITPPAEEYTSGPIPPVLKDGMQAITFTSNGTETVVADTSKNDWYSYEVQTGATDTYNEETGEYGTSHWANAKLNGNYYVWIPRYAYKIDKSVTYTTQGDGTSYKIDVKFIGKDVTSSNVETKIGEGYIVHPAFTFNNSSLSGIWVGKYESSKDTLENVTIIPNAKSYTLIAPATMFTKSQALSTTNNDAHMMKNIEWGAVAYLTQSQYGRNGTEISVNQCTDGITGAGRAIEKSIVSESGSTEADLGTGSIFNNSPYSVDSETNLPPEEQQYNGKIGKLSSTTGNIYGVYDMSGGTDELVAACVSGNEVKLFGVTEGDNTYIDIYTKPSDKYGESINGDAIGETARWNNDNSGNGILNDSILIAMTRGGR